MHPAGPPYTSTPRAEHKLARPHSERGRGLGHHTEDGPKISGAPLARRSSLMFIAIKRLAMIGAAAGVPSLCCPSKAVNFRTPRGLTSRPRVALPERGSAAKDPRRTFRGWRGKARVAPKYVTVVARVEDRIPIPAGCKRLSLSASWCCRLSRKALETPARAYALRTVVRSTTDGLDRSLPTYRLSRWVHKRGVYSEMTR